MPPHTLIDVHRLIMTGTSVAACAARMRADGVPDGLQWLVNALEALHAVTEPSTDSATVAFAMKMYMSYSNTNLSEFAWRIGVPVILRECLRDVLSADCLVAALHAIVHNTDFDLLCPLTQGVLATRLVRRLPEVRCRIPWLLCTLRNIPPPTFLDNDNDLAAACLSHFTRELTTEDTVQLLCILESFSLAQTPEFMTTGVTICGELVVARETAEEVRTVALRLLADAADSYDYIRAKVCAGVWAVTVRRPRLLSGDGYARLGEAMLTAREWTVREHKAVRAAAARSYEWARVADRLRRPTSGATLVVAPGHWVAPNRALSNAPAGESSR